jgi:hypothetical protein
MRRRSRFILLGVLLVVWAGVLWGTFGGGAKGSGSSPPGSISVHSAPPASPPASPAPAPGPSSRDPAVGQVASPALIEEQEKTSALPLGPDPFFPAPLKVAEPKGEGGTSARPEGPREPILTATFLGGIRPSAVVDGKRVHVGECPAPGIKLSKIGEGWVEIEESGAIRKIAMKRPVRKIEGGQP